MKNLIFGTIALMLFTVGSAMFFLTSVFNRVDTETREFEQYIGTEVVLDGDTSIIIDFSIYMNTFTLSNGVEVGKELVIKEEKKITSYVETAFAEGWKDGYKAGWCHGKGYGCLPPLPPLAPLPPIGESSYKHGYNYGFSAGRKANR